MGILDFLRDAATGIAAQASSGSRPSGAIPRGRMKQTDIVTGPDSSLPHAPGVYRHVDKSTGTVDYVGQANDLRKRQQEHVRSGKLDPERQFVQYSEARETATKDDLCRTEVEHIARHHPSGNTTKGGNGRR
jgi:hypothetical protein